MVRVLRKNGFGSANYMDRVLIYMSFYEGIALYRLSEETEKYHDDNNDKERMDEVSTEFETKSKEPQDKEYDDDCPKHSTCMCCVMSHSVKTNRPLFCSQEISRLSSKVMTKRHWYIFALQVKILYTTHTYSSLIKIMSQVSTYLNFPRNTEEAFTFYKSVFGGEFEGKIHRMSEVPPSEGGPGLAEEDKNLVMHVTLSILGGHKLMGTDAPESMGFHLNSGNNVFINLEPDTRVETERLFSALCEGGSIGMPLSDMFWGDYFGSCTDKFGIQWMFNCTEKKV